MWRDYQSVHLSAFEQTKEVTTQTLLLPKKESSIVHPRIRHHLPKHRLESTPTRIPETFLWKHSDPSFRCSSRSSRDLIRLLQLLTYKTFTKEIESTRQSKAVNSQSVHGDSEIINRTRKHLG